MNTATGICAVDEPPEGVGATVRIKPVENRSLIDAHTDELLLTLKCVSKVRQCNVCVRRHQKPTVLMQLNS